MNIIDQNIQNISDVIDRHIVEANSQNRGEISQDILAQLRNLIEQVMIKVHVIDENIEVNTDNYRETIKPAVKFIKNQGKYKLLNDFHDFLQIVASHYTLDPNNSERIMMKYYEYLVKLKKFCEEKLNLAVLTKIEKFPVSINSDVREYLEQISYKLYHITENLTPPTIARFYIYKKTTVYYGKKLFYELTVLPVNERESKSNRTIVFTDKDVLENYIIKACIVDDYVFGSGCKIPIHLMKSSETSIQKDEFNLFTEIVLGKDVFINTFICEKICQYINKNSFSLSDLMMLSEADFEDFIQSIIRTEKPDSFIEALRLSHYICQNHMPGTNVILYLLYRLNPIIMKKLLNGTPNSKLSNLYLINGCIPFDTLPYIFSLPNHNPKSYDLYKCIGISGRSDELFAARIKSNTENQGVMFTPLRDFQNFENIDANIESYNRKISKLYPKFQKTKLVKEKDFIYIEKYKEELIYIIGVINNYTKMGVSNYSQSVEKWLADQAISIDDTCKSEILKDCFEKSRVAVISGSAGTGKTTLINYISSYWKDMSKLYLALTNPAIDNLKKRITAGNSNFMTVQSYLFGNSNDNPDILIIDECSTISNYDMCRILSKTRFKLLVLVGDDMQISSIRFGNWFHMILNILPQRALHELIKTFRTKENKLIEIWQSVRTMKPNLEEYLAKASICFPLDPSKILDFGNNDEIILCLNYDGLYGVNNLNLILQEKNKNKKYKWKMHCYKKGDPILFNDSNIFFPVIYNNLRGTIVNIDKNRDESGREFVTFSIMIEKEIDGLTAEKYNLKLEPCDMPGNSIIKFTVYDNSRKGADNKITVVPFSVAYAISIHKSQGLEYNIVKLIISDESDEHITHDIFYTAVTRAKKSLEIYWNPEVEHKVLAALKVQKISRDIHILESMLGNEKELY